MDMEIDEVEGFLDDLSDELEIADSQPVSRPLEHVLIESPSSFDRKAYKAVEGETHIVKVLEEDDDGDELHYTVRFGDTRHEKVSPTSVVYHEGQRQHVHVLGV